MKDDRRIRRLVLPLAALLAMASPGCEPADSDGAPVEGEVAASPVPDVNPQGFFRADPEE